MVAIRIFGMSNKPHIETDADNINLLEPGQRILTWPGSAKTIGQLAAFRAPR